MNISIYSNSADREQLCRWIDSNGTLAFRQRKYSCCEGYDDFLRMLEQGQTDLLIISRDGADGMESVIAARELQPDTKLIWFSDDKAFGPQSYRLNCTYFAVKPITADLLENAISRCFTANH